MLATQDHVLTIEPSFRPLLANEEAALAFIEGYDFGKIRARIMKEGTVAPEEVDEAIAEFRKFLSLITLGYRSLAMMSGAVDEVWHAFILHTRDYAVFCQQVIGRFIHHQPATETEPVNDNAKWAFVDAYHVVFGKIPVIWGVSEGFGADGVTLLKCSGTTNCQDPECTDTQ